jgi:predicted phage tail component-like protein
MAGNGSSFTYNGTDLGEDAYGLYVVGVSAPLFGKPRVDIRPLSQADGVVTQGSTFGAIEIRMECKVVAPDPANLNTQLEAIAGVLRATAEGEKTLIIDQWPARQYTARLISLFDPDQAIGGAEFSLTWIVPTGTHEDI